MDRTTETFLAVYGEPFELHDDGLAIVGEPSFDEWQACGHWLRRVERSVQFAIGDWVNYGRQRWGEQAEQGLATDAETAAAEATGWKPATVEQYARVAAQVPPERRDPDLTFSHHREVADKTSAEQSSWLARAKAENWSTDKLRAELRAEIRQDPSCWLLVRCADADDRDRLRDKLALDGRECKMP